MLGVLHYLLILCFGIGQITSYEGIEGGLKFLGCDVNLNTPKYPIVTKVNEVYRYYPLEEGDTYRFLPDEQVEFHCPGTTVLLNGTDTGESWVLGTCSNNSQSEPNYMSTDIKCNHRKKATVIISEIECAPDSELISVSYLLKPGQYLHIYKVCFTNEKAVPLYTHHILRPVFFEKPLEVSVPLISIKLDKKPYTVIRDPRSLQIYDIRTQRTKTDIYLRKYRYLPADIREGFNFVPTYLTPPEDLYFTESQTQALRYINTVPTFKIVQSQNWKKLEQQIRSSATKLSTSFEVWTGTFEILEVESGPVYLGFYVDNGRDVSDHPVPRYLWKLLYAHRKAVALFVSDDPFQKKYTPLCNDISFDAGWLNDLDKTNGSVGFSFACNYEDFRKIVSYAPQIEVRGVLTWQYNN